jgi:hypothetical protein
MQQSEVFEYFTGQKKPSVIAESRIMVVVWFFASVMWVVFGMLYLFRL